MFSYGPNYISSDQIKEWLYASQDVDKIFQNYYEKNGKTLSLEQLYEVDKINLQNSNDFDINIDFRSLNPNYSHLQETFLFSETNWFHPFSNIAINRHIRYFPSFSHSHLFFEVCFVIDGNCIHDIFPNNLDKNPNNTRIDQKSIHHIELITGDLLIIPPNCKHAITMNSNSVVVNLLIRKSTFYEVFLNNLPANTSLYNFFSDVLYREDASQLILCHTRGDVNLQNIFYWIATEYCNNDIYSNNIADQLLSIFFSTLLRCYDNKIEFIGSSTDCMHMIPSILQHMEMNYGTTNVKAIAEHFNFNASYLGQIFKEKTGTSLIDALIHIRLSKACNLLTSTNLSVGIIAEMIGYSDTTYFIRLFKTHFGKTPYQYRKTNKNSLEY